MVYLYAALGVMMMTGIMAVFEMGLSLTGQSLLLKPDDPYRESLVTDKVGVRDQEMLRLLRDSEHLAAIDFDKDPAKDLCDKVLERITVEERSRCYLDGEYIPSESCDNARLLSDLKDANDFQIEQLPNACAIKSDSLHRMILQRDPDPEDSINPIPYRLFSCVLPDGKALACDFELSR